MGATGGDHHDTTPEEARTRSSKASEAEEQPLEGWQTVESRDDTEVGTRR